MKLNSRVSAICLIVIIQLNLGLSKRIRKRQIYREEVQPHIIGGKIPETAFETDRLLLNRLQKEGIAVPDGVVLEQRNPRVYPYSNSDLRPVFKVQLTSDNRFTDDNGQVLGSLPPVSETTYPIPLITGDRLPQDPIQRTVYQPIYRQFVLPNPYLQNPDLSPNTIVQFRPKGFHGSIASSHQLFHSPSLLTSFATLHPKYPYSHSALRYYYEDYAPSQIFDDFSRFIGQVGRVFPFAIPLR